ncbi:MAG: hypothetical protein IPP06_12635 [Saprospiraceae bacterium]|nr:hypothetical protein [Candidatus Vicinibacter affinis]
MKTKHLEINNELWGGVYDSVLIWITIFTQTGGKMVLVQNMDFYPIHIVTNMVKRMVVPMYKDYEILITLIIRQVLNMRRVDVYMLKNRNCK